MPNHDYRYWRLPLPRKVSIQRKERVSPLWGINVDGTFQREASFQDKWPSVNLRRERYRPLNDDLAMGTIEYTLKMHIWKISLDILLSKKGIYQADMKPIPAEEDELETVS